MFGKWLLGREGTYKVLALESGEEQHCCQIYSTLEYCFKIFIKCPQHEAYCTLVSQSSRLTGEIEKK